MPIYDKNITTPIEEEALPKTNENYIHFSDGAFYPFLKYLISTTTGIPNSHIYIKDYGENNPFLEQSKAPKVFCELYKFDTPSISGSFDYNGNMLLFAHTKYRVYFVNDNWRAPFLFEASFKGNVDKLENIIKDFKEAKEVHKLILHTPEQLTMGTKKEHKGFSTYPIVTYDVLMSGYIIQNIKELESIPFDRIEDAVILK